MLSSKTKLVLLGVEILAFVALKVIFALRRDNKDRPVGGRVPHVRGRPVFKFPFLGGHKEPELPAYDFKPTYKDQP